MAIYHALRFKDPKEILDKVTNESKIYQSCFYDPISLYFLSKIKGYGELQEYLNSQLIQRDYKSKEGLYNQLFFILNKGE